MTWNCLSTSSKTRKQKSGATDTPYDVESEEEESKLESATEYFVEIPEEHSDVGDAGIYVEQNGSIESVDEIEPVGLEGSTAGVSSNQTHQNDESTEARFVMC